MSLGRILRLHPEYQPDRGCHKNEEKKRNDPNVGNGAVTGFEDKISGHKVARLWFYPNSGYI